jgi:hypothetical protein
VPALGHEGRAARGAPIGRRNAASLPLSMRPREFLIRIACPAMLFTWSRDWDYQFAVLLGDEVFGTAG